MCEIYFRQRKGWAMPTIYAKQPVTPKTIQCVAPNGAENTGLSTNPRLTPWADIFRPNGLSTDLKPLIIIIRGHRHKFKATLLLARKQTFLRSIRTFDGIVIL